MSSFFLFNNLLRSLNLHIWYFSAAQLTSLGDVIETWCYLQNLPFDSERFVCSFELPDVFRKFRFCFVIWVPK